MIKKYMFVGILVVSLSSVACSSTATTTPVSSSTAETTDTIESIDINNETKDIGITEAGGGYSGITSDNQAVVKLNTITLSSGYEFTEEEANLLDLMITAWIEKPELQRDFLEERVNDKDLYQGLSDSDKLDLVEQIVTKYPHTAPVEATKPAESKPSSKPQETKPSTPTNKPAESKPSAPKETQAPAQDNSGSIDWGAMAEEEMKKDEEAIANGSAVPGSGATNVGPVTIDPEALKRIEEAGAQGN